MDPVDFTEYWIDADIGSDVWIEHRPCSQSEWKGKWTLQDLIDWANEHADKCPRENGARAVEDRPL